MSALAHCQRMRALLFATLSLLPCSLALACELRMGYRPEARPPLMAAEPRQDGLYRQLYERAARQIGCELVVVRLPKIRMLRALQSGDVDFYPGLDFDTERGTYLLFIPNGLPGGVVGLSRRDLPEVRHVDQIAGLRLLVAAGQPERLQAMAPALRARLREERVVSASLEAAVNMLIRERGDFLIYTEHSINYLLNSRPDLRAQLHVHRDCCGGKRANHLGFAKASRHVRLQPNPAHDPARPASADNQTERSAPGTVAARLAAKLAELARSGETQGLLRQHGLEPPR